MAKAIRCPQCSGINPDKVAEGEYKCTYCGSLFHIEEKKPFSNLNDILKTIQNRKHVQTLDPNVAKRVGRAVRFTVFLAIAGIVAGIAIPIFVANRTVTNALGMESAPGWSVPSVDKQEFFVGTKGAVHWKLMKESGDRLDSARYTLQIVDLEKNKVLATKRWEKTVTWQAGFQFGEKYFAQVFATGDTVWVTSSENIVNGYNMYTGKNIITSDDLVENVKEFNAGISQVTQLYDKPAFDVKTDDGYSYTYFPGNGFIVKKDEYYNYNDKHKTRKIFYTLSEEQRPVLWKVVMPVGAFDKSNNVTYYIENSRKAIRNNYMYASSGIEKLDSVPAPMIFFNGKLLWWDNEGAIVVYRQSLAKKASAYMAYVREDGSVKWKTLLDDIPGLAEAYQNDQYIRYFTSDQQIMVLHQSATDIAAGIDVKTGKIRWKWNEK